MQKGVIGVMAVGIIAFPSAGRDRGANGELRWELTRSHGVAVHRRHIVRRHVLPRRHVDRQYASPATPARHRRRLQRLQVAIQELPSYRLAPADVPIAEQLVRRGREGQMPPDADRKRS